MKGVIFIENYREFKMLIVDDNEEILTIVESTLRKSGFEKIYKANSSKRSLELFKNINPHFIILDIMLDAEDGYEILRKIRETSQVPILFLSAKDEPEDKLIGLGIGADDYMVKPFLPKELVLRVKSIIKRCYFLKINNTQDLVFKLGEKKIDLNTGTIKADNKETILTAKEYSLLKILYKNKNKIVSKDLICDYVWEDTFWGYENTLMVHIRKLREKIEKDPSMPNYLLTVKGLGYKLLMDEEK